MASLVYEREISTCGAATAVREASKSMCSVAQIVASLLYEVAVACTKSPTSVA